ncbi:MAG: hypothetical protein M1817_005796 [Caeruleum heppii]|nr:MAG: hypothetical protein M1817_005796 [Caeruleum heppii]
MARARRASSGLGGDPRGDTGAPAVSTLDSPLASPFHFIGQSKSQQQRNSAQQSRTSTGLYTRWKNVSLRHTWFNPLLVVIAVLSGYAYNPTASNPLHGAIFLSYPAPEKTVGDPTAQLEYAKGGRDFEFVAFYTVALSFTREFIMQCLIRPMAIRCGIKGRQKQARFMEQVYTAIYFALIGPLGLSIMWRSPLWYFNTTACFENYPHKTLEGNFKAYYLFQAAYWSQQALVLLLQLEKPRKDFKELVGHHIITIALIWLSYRFHFTHMGLLVYITHDVSDFFLATSKTLNYLDSVVVGPYFAFFTGVWIYLRHYINWHLLYAMIMEFRTVGPFDASPVWDTQQYKSPLAQYIGTGLMASLQAVNLFWLFLIFRIAKNYVFAKTWADERSEAEDEDEDEDNADNINDPRYSNGELTLNKTSSVEANGSAIPPADTSRVMSKKME